MARAPKGCIHNSVTYAARLYKMAKETLVRPSNDCSWKGKSNTFIKASILKYNYGMKLKHFEVLSMHINKIM